MKSKLAVGLAVLATVFMFPASAWAAVTFAPAVSYPAGDRTFSVAVGDLNGDGKPDLATANLNSDNVSVLLGNGDGTFATAVDYSAGDGPISVAIGDFNGDGKPDLAVANGNASGVSVLLGNGDGTFTAAVVYATDSGPRSVAIGDFNGDGKPDLATANRTPDTVSVLLGVGDGTFAAATNHPAGSRPSSVAIGDLNGDGDLDLATANQDPTGSEIGVLLGNGDGTFAAVVKHPAGQFPTSVAIGDLNGDGKPDLISSDQNDFVSVLLGNGDGTFAPAANYAAGGSPASVAIGDLDGDGKPDLATANNFADSVSVLPGNGDGTFAAAAQNAAGDGPFSVAIGDLNGDGKPDLVSANNGTDDVSVLLNTTPTSFTTSPTATISGAVRQGQTLTADEGSPDPVPDSFAYEWLADGVAIGGATAKTFELTSAEVGKKISVTVTATKAGFTDASDTSDETVAVEGIFTPGPTASISGLRRVGSTLTANVGSPSPAPDSFAYRWYLDGKLLATTTKTLKLGAGAAGKQIHVKVYAIKAGYLTAADLSPATTPISNLQAKTISMELNDYTVARRQRLYAEIELLAPSEPFTIVLDGKTLATGKANTKGIAVVGLTIPTNATTGTRTIRANGAFPDRTDPDTITVR